MPQRAPREQRGVEAHQLKESFCTLADFARIVGIPYRTLYGWYRGGKLPVPDAPHPRSPMWTTDSIDRWVQDFADSVLTRDGYERTLHKEDDDAGEATLEQARGISFGRRSVGALLGYQSPGSLKAALPAPDRVDFSSGHPRWYSETIAAWVAENPRRTERVRTHSPAFFEEHVRPLL